MYKQALFNLMDKFMQGLPPEIQQQLQALEPEQMDQEILNMMGALNSSETEQQMQEQPIMDEMMQQPPIPMEGDMSNEEM
jgi:hypothetical protein